tara:strand:- start:109 stop:360 length:252 start_codon:yes stop_codon:yes gene_type:complete
MCKRKYKITEKDESFKVEIWDEYGNYNSVYEESYLLALEYVMEWFSKSEEREKSNKLMNKAIKECIKIDRESGITSRNRDCLD